jgi:hypothetical protein
LRLKKAFNDEKADSICVDLLQGVSFAAKVSEEEGAGGRAIHEHAAARGCTRESLAALD